MNVEVNVLALLVGAIGAMAVGFLWYSPMLFGNQWMKLMGYTKASMSKAKNDMGKTYAISFVTTLLMGYVMTHFLAFAQIANQTPGIMTGLLTAFWAWLGFVAPVQLTDVLFGSKKWSLFAINTGYQLASLLVMGLAIGYWL